MTNFSNLSVGGAPVLGNTPNPFGNVLYVNASGGSAGHTGKSIGRSFATISQAVSAASAGSTIYVAKGAYDETVTIPRAKSGLTIIGTGGRGAAFIEPSTEDAGGMIVNADDVTLINLGVAGEDATSAVALTVTGARFRAERCKFEGGLTQLSIGPGTVIQVDTDETHGDAADAIFDDCEFCWGTNGVMLAASDYGAVTQPRFRRCKFYNLSAAAMEESGATAAVHYRDLLVEECVFMPNEGAAPTKYISLNDDNGNDGVVARCTFPTAINSGLNLVSTALLWVSNFHSGGISTAQPS